MGTLRALGEKRTRALVPEPEVPVPRCPTCSPNKKRQHRHQLAFPGPQASAQTTVPTHPLAVHTALLLTEGLPSSQRGAGTHGLSLTPRSCSHLMGQ